MTSGQVGGQTRAAKRLPSTTTTRATSGPFRLLRCRQPVARHPPEIFFCSTGREPVGIRTMTHGAFAWALTLQARRGSSSQTTRFGLPKRLGPVQFSAKLLASQRPTSVLAVQTFPRSFRAKSPICWEITGRQMAVTGWTSMHVPFSPSRVSVSPEGYPVAVDSSGNLQIYHPCSWSDGSTAKVARPRALVTL